MVLPPADEGEHAGSKLARKAKEAPFMAAGLGGLIAAVVIGAYKFKTRSESASVFLMKYRVLAQGTVVSCLTLGLAYTMIDEYLQKKEAKRAAKEASSS